MLRSIGAVVIGFLLTVVLAFGTEFALITLFHREPFNDFDREPIMLVILLFTTTGSVAMGGYAAGQVAVGRPQAHALVMGVLLLLGDLLLALTYWRNEAAWYYVGTLALILPAATIGGWVSDRQQAVA